MTAFLAGGLVGVDHDLAGEPYQDADGQRYGPLIRQPILIFEADADGLKKIMIRALSKNIRPTIYTHELFTTAGDAQNRAAVAAVHTDDLNLVGIALHAERKQVDKVLKGFRLHH